MISNAGVECLCSHFIPYLRLESLQQHNTVCHVTSHADAMLPSVNARSIALPTSTVRMFGYRNMIRRLHAVASLARSPLPVVLDRLRTFKIRNISKMHTVLANTSLQDLAFTVPFVFTEEHRHHLLTALSLAVFQLNHQRVITQDRALLVPHYVSTVLDALPWHTIFTSRSVMSLLPRYCTSCPLLVFKYNKPLGATFFNYRQVADIPWDRQLQIMSSSSCVCTDRHHLRHLIPDGLSHIVTTDASFLPTIALQNLWKFGSKHRPSLMQPLSPELRQHIQHIIDSAVTSYARKLERKFAVADCMTAWRLTVVQHIHDALAKLPDGYCFTVHGENFDALAPALTYADARTLRNTVHSKFAIVPVDKASGTFAAYCLKWYLTCAHSDLLHNQYYDTNVSITPSDVLHDHNEFYRCNSFPGFSALSQRLPFMSAMAKLHKTPIANRFLVNSYDTSLTLLSKWLTWAFKAIQGDLDSMFLNVLRSLGADGVQVATTIRKCWVINSSADVIPILQAFNAHYTAQQHTNTQWVLRCLDFARLYTNIPLQDLTHRLADMTCKVFRLHSATPALKVFAGGKFQWLSHVPVSAVGRDKSKGKYRIFTAPFLIKCIRKLVENTYFCFGKRLFRQIMGIPMGTNCAVYLANSYLYMYELQFWMQFQNFQDRAMLKTILWNFAFTVRYIDDLLTLHNLLIMDLLYTTSNYHGIHGIYPPCLSLEVACEGPSVHYTDITLYTTNHGLLSTMLYDKRREPKFAVVQYIKFPHVTSALSKHCKYNIFTSQFHRFRRIILNRDNFIQETSLLVQHMVLNQGYSSRLIHKKLRRLLHVWKGLFSGTSPRYLYDTIILRSQQMNGPTLC